MAAKNNRTYIKTAFFIYLLVTFTIILSNSFIFNFNFHTEYTISRYIGLSTWSAIIFAIASLIIFYNIFQYLKNIKKEHKMNKLWWFISLITIIALIFVGLFPVGYFDQTFGDFGVVSKIHRTSAYIMFCSSILMTFLTTIKFYKERIFRTVSIFFIIYGLLFVFGYAFNVNFFQNTILFSETVFLAIYLLVLYLIPEKPSKNLNNKSGTR